MATTPTPQQYIQPTAQAAVPSAVNNGNPNTVYNTPWQTSFNNLYPNQQAIPPMTTANGAWFQPNNATKTPMPWTPPAAQTIQKQTVQWPDPVFPANPGGGTTPPTTPPTGTPNGGGGGGGGWGGIGTGNPETGVNFNPLDPRNNGNYTPGQPGWESLLKQSGVQVGLPGTDSWNRAQQWSNAVYDRLGGAKNPDGSWNWQQIVDMVTEPLLGGNLYLSGTGKWDASNGIASLVQAVTGIPLGNIMNKLGEWQATQNDPADTWLEKMLADHWEDNANNDIKVFQNTLNSYLGNYADWKVGQINTGTSNSNQNWLNTYTDALANAMLSGLKGQAASDAARAAANAAGQNTNPPAGSGGGTTGGGRQGGGYDGYLGEGVSAYDGGCVVVDNIIEGYEFALDVKVGDSMIVVDANTFERRQATVSHSETIRRPCVRLETKHGVVLECSVDAEIADENGERVLAKDLLGVAVPSMIDGVKTDDVVMKVEEIGTHPVQKITCENSWYLAGKEKGKYLLHHNVKFFNEYGNRTSSSGWQGSGSITPNGLKWGW